MELLLPEEREVLGLSFRSSMLKLAGRLGVQRPVPQAPSSAVTEPEPTAPVREGIETEVKLACIRVLLELNGISGEQALALVKSAAVSPDDARRSLDRLDTLERNRPSVGQVARYGTIGGVGGAATGAIGHLIEHGSPLKGATPKAKLLSLAANAAKGAVGGSAIPLLRGAGDRRAEMGKLRRFVNEGGGPGA